MLLKDYKTMYKKEFCWEIITNLTTKIECMAMVI